jgi:alkanesulfonate monooxygenase SsuD/methylene tetrahydromethanopterin reductase-like flavin-dependent oxidoreductase (luciferase family)
MQAAIDEAARAAGRDPAAIERAVNLMVLDGSPEAWADRLAAISTDLGFTTLIVGLPDEGRLDVIRRLGEDVAPRLRELVP